ncbi:MAG: hypothetical protein KDA83_17180, partial [Planctomycetales bacterium]|nr:hypothetical protein [Planctomycetales bacterium]
MSLDLRELSQLARLVFMFARHKFAIFKTGMASGANHNRSQQREVRSVASVASSHEPGLAV